MRAEQLKKASLGVEVIVDPLDQVMGIEAEGASEPLDQDMREAGESVLGLKKRNLLKIMEAQMVDSGFIDPIALLAGPSVPSARQ